MRIAVIGTHGVGKSTLVTEFARRKPEYYVIPEIAREMIVERNGRISSWFDFQLELMARKIKAEQEAKKYKHVISDRTAIDNWAYCKYYMVFPENLLYSMRELAIGYCNDYYDLFVYLPASDFVITKSRHADRCARIDETVASLLPRLRKHVILRGGIEERVNRLVSIVEEAEPPVVKETSAGGDYGSEA